MSQWPDELKGVIIEEGYADPKNKKRKKELEHLFKKK